MELIVTDILKEANALKHSALLGLNTDEQWEHLIGEMLSRFPDTPVDESAIASSLKPDVALTPEGLSQIEASTIPLIIVRDLIHSGISIRPVNIPSWSAFALRFAAFGHLTI